MNHTAQVIVRFAVAFVMGFTLTYCTCWLLSLFLWTCLAAVLSALIIVTASHTETGLAAVERAGDLAVEGCAATLNAFRGLRARFNA